MIIPTEQENFLAECFTRAKFQLSRLCSVYHEMGSESKLSMVEYSNDMQVLEKSSLIMYQNKNGLKTKEFEAMTYNFYDKPRLYRFRIVFLSLKVLCLFL